MSLPAAQENPAARRIESGSPFLLLLGLSLVCLGAWYFMAAEAARMAATGVCECLGMQMAGPDMTAWPAATILPLFLMWAEMMVAMMLPSAAPMILVCARVNGRQQQNFNTLLFATGYLAVWTLFSLGAALLQWWLHASALLTPGMASASEGISGGLLIAAGLFQWTPLKSACLVKCRTPLTFLMTRWRPGPRGALTMGIEHGAYCTGCCWFLMALLFVVGVMNLWWIVFLTLVVIAEKMAPNGPFIARAAGIAFIIWGILLLTA